MPTAGKTFLIMLLVIGILLIAGYYISGQRYYKLKSAGFGLVMFSIGVFLLFGLFLDRFI